MNKTTPEQQVRDILERMEVPNAQKYSAGELVELANIVAENERSSRAGWISVEDRVPEHGEYVIAFFPDRPWSDRNSLHAQHKCAVVKFLKGLYQKDREQLPDRDVMKNVYRPEDEHGNNLRPFCWRSFGPGTYFGQEATHWMPLPKPPKEPGE